MKEEDRTWRVDAFVTQVETIYVRARSGDQAVGRARERLAVDRLPSGYSTCGGATEVDDESRLLADGRRLDEPEHAEKGVRLSDEERAYCGARGYGVGFDVDAFDGLQWSHLVDDGVAFCRTTALWFWDPVLRGEAISCPFCVDVLRRELLYPMPRLSVLSRRNGRGAVARVTEATGELALRIRGVEIRRVDAGSESQWELRELCRRINDAGPGEGEIESPGPMRLAFRNDRVARYVLARLRCDDARRRLDDGGEVSAEAVALREASVDALGNELSQDELASANAYLRS